MFIYENKGLLFPVNTCASVCERADSAQVHACASAGLVLGKRKITAAFKSPISRGLKVALVHFRSRIAQGQLCKGFMNCR